MHEVAVVCLHDWQVFSRSGSYRFKFGGVGSSPGRLLHPAGVCCDRHGNMFVADRDNCRVQLFNKVGGFIGVIIDDTSATTSGGKDIRPLDVAITSQSRLVVLLTGIEGVDSVEVHIYEVLCSLPPPEVRSVQQIIATIRSLGNSSANSHASRLRLGSGRRDTRLEQADDKTHGTTSQICVIAWRRTGLCRDNELSAWISLATDSRAWSLAIHCSHSSSSKNGFLQVIIRNSRVTRIGCPQSVKCSTCDSCYSCSLIYDSVFFDWKLSQQVDLIRNCQQTFQAEDELFLSEMS